MDQRSRSLVVVIVGALAALGPFSVDMYLPGFPAIARDLKTDMATVEYTLTTYFIGFSLGQLMLGPILDRYGRRRPLMIGLVIYIAAAIGCVFSPTIHYLIALRLALAMGSCVGMVGSSTVVRDLFTGREVARALSMMMTIFGFAPVIAPSIGGLVVATLGWRAIFGVLAAMGLFVLIAVRSGLPETRQPDPAVSLKPGRAALAYLEVFKERTFVIYVLAAALGSGGLFAYITGAPFVYMGLFGFSTVQFAWIFGGNGLAIVIGNQVNRAVLKKWDSAVILLAVGTLQSTIGVLLLVGTLLGLLPTWLFLLLVFLFLFCLGFIGSNAGALAILPFSKNVGSASALMGGTLMVSGALASWFVGYLDNGTAVPMALVMAVCALSSLVFSIRGKLAAAGR
jgi:DHA1 family bicyclomycin/chloramphenicol resistance-like MFS transporter